MSWWRSWRNNPITARVALPTDRGRLAAFLADTWQRYGNLAPEDQAALLREGTSSLALVRDQPVGFLGLARRAPAGTPPELWLDVDLVGLANEPAAGRTLGALLEPVLPRLRGEGCTGLVCLAPEGWLSDGLMQAGFVPEGEVVSYAHTGGGELPQAAGPADLRTIGPGEGEAVLALNAAAFEPFWRYDDATVMSWLLAADRPVLAWLEGSPVGFALTTDGVRGSHAHLIRIATHPAARRRGVGRQLVADAIRYAYDSGAPGLALNTQAANAASRRLYESLGFRPTGQTLEVMVLRL